MRIGLITSEYKSITLLNHWLQRFAEKHQYEFETTHHLSPQYSELKKVWALINLCDLLVADISDNDPNIIYEIGLAHGLRKPVVLFTQSKLTLPPVFLGQEIMTYDPLKLESANLEYKLIQIMNKFPMENRLRGPRDEEKILTLSNRATEINFRDIYALRGTNRAAQFENWFYSLLSNIPAWDVLEQEPEFKDRGYDFIVWNNSLDSEFAALGNPIAIELKIGSFDKKFIVQQFNNAQLKHIKGIILATMAGQLINKKVLIGQYKSTGIVMIVLSRDDLIDVKSPNDLFSVIRNKLSEFLYSGAYSV